MLTNQNSLWTTTLPALVGEVTTKRQAIAWVKAEANAIIEQAERRAKGWDRDMFRDDDCFRYKTIEQRTRESVELSFALSKKFQSAAA